MKNTQAQIRIVETKLMKVKTSHLLHFFLTILTLGFWLPIWILVALSHSLEISGLERKLNKLYDME